MNAGKRTPGPWATGLANLTPIEAMRQDRKKLVAKMETLTAERATLREALLDVRAALDMYADGPATQREMVASRIVNAALALVDGAR